MLRGALLIWSCFLLTGCDEKELQKIRKVGDKALDKAGQLALDAWNKMQRPGIEPTATTESYSLVQKIQFRIQWDQQLTEVPIQISVEHNQVKLNGEVPSEELKKRALDLVQSTKGVEKVIDLLTIKKADLNSATADLKPAP